MNLTQRCWTVALILETQPVASAYVSKAGHHQRLLEHAPVDKLDRLGGAMKWIELNLGPWPI